MSKSGSKKVETGPTGRFSRRTLSKLTFDPAAVEGRLWGYVPRGWTAGFPERVRRMMCGNSVCVPKIEFIGRAIMAAA